MFGYKSVLQKFIECCLIAVLCSFVSVAGAQDVQEREILGADGILAKLKDPGTRFSEAAQQDAVDQLLDAEGLELKRNFKKVPRLMKFGVKARVAGRNAEDVRKVSKVELLATIKRLKDSGRFEYVEPNWRYSVSALPNDGYFTDGTLWGVNNTGAMGGVAGVDIHVKPAWNDSTGAGVIVAVVDTGVRYDHSDLKASMWVNPGEIAGNGIDDDQNGYVDDVHGINAIRGNGNPMDDQGHGSHCAGTIAAQANGGGKHVGVAYDAKIMALKFLDKDGVGTTEDAITCLEYAIDMGAHITNNSWGGEGFSQALFDTVSAAEEAGILFVAAAGNDGLDNDRVEHYPSNLDLESVISVAAMDRSGTIASFSNFGRNEVDVAAPGVAIVSSVSSTTSAYDDYSGTSMAAPHVAGVAALIKSKFPDASHLELKQRLMLSTRALPGLYGMTRTEGIIDAYASLQLAEDGDLEVIAKTEGPAKGGLLSAVGISITDIFPVTNATVSANLVGSPATNFFDNGVSPDRVGGDGIYTAKILLPTQGTSAAFQVRAVASGYSNFDGEVSLTIPQPPVNDRFADRITLPNDRNSIFGSTRQASEEPGEIRVPGAGSSSAWFEWRANATGSENFRIDPGTIPHGLAIFRGGPDVDDLVLLGSDAQPIAAFSSSVTINVTAGTTYYISVAPVGNQEGSFRLIYPYGGAVDGEPVITRDPVGTTVTIGDELILTADVVGDDPLSLQWYRNGNAIGGQTSKTLSIAQVRSSNEGSYFMRATNSHGSVDSRRAFVLVERVSSPPPNDNFALAQRISGSGGQVNGLNDRATGEQSEPNHAGASRDFDGVLQSVWYEWVAPGFGSVTFDTNGSRFDTTMGVYTGSSVGDLVEIKSDNNGGSGNSSRATMTVVGGVTYYIAVDSVDDGKGNLTLNWDFVSDGRSPANDLFENAVELIGNRSDSGSNFSSAGERDEPQHLGDSGEAHSVWWRWRAPSIGSATVSLAGSNFDTLLAVYKGSSIETLSEVVSNDNDGGNLYSRVEFTTEPGVIYYFAVDGKGGAQGGVNLSIDYSENSGQPGKVLLVDNGGTGFGDTAKILNQAGYNVTEVRDEISRGFGRVKDLNYLKQFDLLIYGERSAASSGSSLRMTDEVRDTLYKAFRTEGVSVLLTGVNSLLSDASASSLVGVSGVSVTDSNTGEATCRTGQQRTDPVLVGPFGDFRNQTFELSAQNDDSFTMNGGYASAWTVTGEASEPVKIFWNYGLRNGGNIYYWNGGLPNGQPVQPEFYDGAHGQGMLLNIAAKACGYTEVASNEPPVARIGFDFTVVDLDDSGSELVSLDGSASTDADGEIISYTWKWSDPYVQSFDRFVYGKMAIADLPVGQHTIELTVRDSLGGSGTDTVVVTVIDSAGIQAPVAHAGSDVESVDTNHSGDELVNLDGTGSSDPDGDIVSWVWSWDGGTATGEIASALFPVGETVVTLRVTDGDGAFSEDTMVVTVNPAVDVSSLMVHWNLNEGSGEAASNIAGSGLDGALSGTYIWGAGAIGGGVSLDGSSGVIETALTPAGMEAFTVSFWVNLASAGQNGYSSAFSNTLSGGSGTFQIDLGGGSNTGKFQYNGSSAADFGAAVVGQWVHLVVVCDGTNTRLYYNGALANELAGVADITGFSGVRLGKNRNGRRALAAGFDEFKMFDEALDSVGVQALYGERPMGSDAYADWKLIEFSAADRLEGFDLDEADPDGDGFSNFMEYALGLNPKVGDAPMVPVFDDGEELLCMEFSKPTGRTDITYTAMYSDDLKDWTPAVIREVRSEGGMDQMRAEAPMGSNGRRFITLRVQRNSF